MQISLARTNSARQACFDIRRAVFIDEQRIPEAEEWDAFDDSCTHVLASAPSGQPAGTARIIGKGDMAKIGRVAVLPEFRGTGLGRDLVQFCLQHARQSGFAGAELEAQLYAIPFYERLGFTAEGPEFDDGSGILHRYMALGFRRAQTSATVAQ
ncbi:GNAT family N-acetyltransferase [Maritalea mobilis]|uniref:GNAT family N-acetyltransferase n=1 Tax=Maritalea mobilis TaxID=483324 RepID=UPI001C950B6E|nr:GNAT family N-acetyltransferase [Maritalea mobilis]MBY6202914.1 GNAT family N-acetyltransferase [Maritalea mobilis]